MVWKLETNRIINIKEKIFKSLTTNDIIFLRKFIHKHWYRCLYLFLGFDYIDILKKY